MRKSTGLLLLALLGTASQAKTPQQLKADLGTIMPAGKKARMVWQQGGTWRQPGNLDLYVVDSDDGVIRKLNTRTINAENPHLTADGRRIIYGDRLSGRIFVVNWDGTEEKVVVNSGRCVGYWRNPRDSSDWVLTSGTVKRINVDSKEEVILYNRSPSLGGSPLLGISADGTRLSGYFQQPTMWDPGVIVVPNGEPVFSSKKGGCGMGMAPDNSYDYFVHWARLSNGHHGIQFYNGTQPKDTFTITAGVIEWARANNMDNGCGQNQEYQNAKMTNDRNFVTFCMFSTKANPYIIRLSDRRWVAIDDQLGCTYAHGLDVVFLPSGPIKASPRVRSEAIRGLPDSDRQAYGIDGRKVKNVFSLSGSRRIGTPRAIVDNGKGVILLK